MTTLRSTLVLLFCWPLLLAYAACYVLAASSHRSMHALLFVTAVLAAGCFVEPANPKPNDTDGTTGGVDESSGTESTGG